MKSLLCTLLALICSWSLAAAQSLSATQTASDVPRMAQVDALRLPWTDVIGRTRRLDIAQGMDFGDVDGDGYLDLFIGPLTPTLPRARLFLNDGSGRFLDASASRVPANDSAFGVRLHLVDVDGDADLDVLGSSFDSRGGTPLILYLNDGSGHFADESDLRLASLPGIFQSYATNGVGDVDGDGDVDMVTGGYGGATQGQAFALFENDGRGHFSVLTAPFPANRIGDQTSEDLISLVDADVDGDLDLFAAGDRGLGMVYYRNDGGLRFSDVSTTHLDVAIHSARIWSVVLADFDADGDVDIVAATHPFWPEFYVLLNDGTGTFLYGGIHRMPASGGTAYTMRALDIDDDGDLDVLCVRGPSAGALAGSHILYLNDGQANFRYDAERRFFGPDPVAGLHHFLSGDLDGDGDPEIIEQSIGSASQQTWHIPYYTNTHRQLLAVAPAQRGRDWLLEIHGPPGSQALLLLSPVRAPRAIPILGLGTLGLDPASIVSWTPAVITAADRRVRVGVPIPNLPQLLNASIFAQALLNEPNVGARLTNLWVERAIR